MPPPVAEWSKLEVKAVVRFLFAKGTKCSVIYRELKENTVNMQCRRPKSFSGVLGSKTAEQVCKMNQGLDARTQQTLNLTMTGTQLEFLR
ncbi:hypothetical protein ElyMa_000437400 [Elysia marginata]|uniref:Mos1 transposase HTH domain-containing protein n=1 Tax=Elysia marginata TaxID=1093978 RepID=A0AAV4FP76_9GAST|nr:hypothetical protein ElyMa_000437400 [Elysia marginata]